MEPKMQKDERPKSYQPPTVTRVHIDPVKDLLMTCLQTSGGQCDFSPTS
jgi:hypothetical protein